MTRFISKPILTTQTTGERLAKVRAGNNLLLTEVARRIGIKTYYLQAIETGQYGELPGDIYTLEFVKTYARFLRLDAAEIVSRYVIERERYTPKAAKKEPIRHWPKVATVFKTAFSMAAAGALVYALILSRALMLPPKLEVFSPAVYYESTGSLVVLSGQTEPGSKVFVNNKEIRLDEQGSFNETFNLSPGLSLLKITAQDKRGRIATLYRTIRTGAAVAGERVSRTLFYGPMASPN